MALDVNTAGFELVKSVLTLYRSAKYSREREVIAKNMIDRALEAGRLITELAVCPEPQENAIAHNALDELNKTLFIVKALQYDGVYSDRRVKPVTALGEQLKGIIHLYIVDGSGTPFTASAPATQLPSPQYASEPMERLALPADPDGFNDVYYGK